MLRKPVCHSLALLIALGLALASQALAQYPERPVSLIVPFGTGGSTDTNARMLAMELEKAIGQRVVVKNISGAAGLTGTKAIADARPDGYTFGYIPPAVVVMHPHVRKVAYSLSDFDPVALAVSFPYVLYTRKDSPWKGFEDMITDMQSNPGKYFVGQTGVGSMPYFAIMSVLAENRIKANMVTFKVDGDAMQAMMGNRIALYSSSPGISKTYEVRPLVSLSKKRSPYLPDVPAIREFGADKHPFVHWQAVVAPKGTPGAAIDLISAAVKQVSESETYLKKLEKICMAPDYMPPEETRRFMEAENDMYARVTRDVMAAVKQNKK